nr:MAG TPA: hypothetical protein [Caudoviricetes sp.]
MLKNIRFCIPNCIPNFLGRIFQRYSSPSFSRGFTGLFNRL